jgi:aminocarboxymuconate-semialdehyde decarboxylase
MRIDFHNHYYPPGYMEKFQDWGGSRFEFYPQKKSGMLIVKQKGARFLAITPEHTSVEKRLEDMDRLGVDMQVLTLTSPSVYFSTRKRNLYLSKISNDFFAELCQKHPKRFSAFATLPLLNTDDAAAELHRAVKDLGMKGVVFGSNIDGKHLHVKEFWPLYKEIQKLDIPIMLHPMVPPRPEPFAEFVLVPLVGFCMDTTVSVAKMVFSGLFEKYPKLTMILPHLGGTLPFLMERLDMGYAAYAECKPNIPKPPSHYLKRFYYDTVSFSIPALMCTYLAVGADHMVMGSDYPHVIGDIDRCVTSIQELKITKQEKKKILGGNGKKILKLA